MPYDPVIPPLGIYLKECKSSYCKGICTLMFIAGLFTIAKLWKQPTCPTIDKWIRKLWYLYTLEFYSDTKKNEILLFAGKWMELENIILNEGIQVQKVKSYCVFSHMWNIKLTQIQQYYEKQVMLRGGHI
jgi:hypothetical protein